MKRQRSYYAKPEDFERQWILIDAADQVLGRLATKVASILRGKENVRFTPSVDVGDFVVVINAEKVRVTGKKAEDKVYYRHTGYAGGLKETTFKEAIEKNAADVIMHAVKGMLPNNRLGRQMLKKVKVYNGAEHPHQAQEPVEMTGAS